MIGLHTEFKYWSHLFIVRTTPGNFMRPWHPVVILIPHTENAKLRAKKGVQQMRKRPMTTATVVAMRRSWNQSKMILFGRSKDWLENNPDYIAESAVHSAVERLYTDQPRSQGLSSYRLGRARRDLGWVWSRATLTTREGYSVIKQFVARPRR